MVIDVCTYTACGFFFTCIRSCSTCRVGVSELRPLISPLILLWGQNYVHPVCSSMKNRFSLFGTFGKAVVASFSFFSRSPSPPPPPPPPPPLPFIVIPATPLSRPLFVPAFDGGRSGEGERKRSALHKDTRRRRRPLEYRVVKKEFWGKT